MIKKVEGSFPDVFDIRSAFAPSILGEEFCTDTLGISKEQFEDPFFDTLGHLGFSNDEIDEVGRAPGKDVEEVCSKCRRRYDQLGGQSGSFLNGSPTHTHTPTTILVREVFFKASEFETKKSGFGHPEAKK